MRKLTSILIAGLLVLGMVAGTYAAEKRDIVVESSYYVNNQWPDLETEIDKGNWGALIGPMAAAMFEAAYPNVKIQPVPWKMWGPDAGERLRASLAAGEAPSFYAAVYADVGGPQGMINEGMLADITDLVNKWDQKDHINQAVWQAAWKEDKCYGIPHRLSSYMFMSYRKDWFKEAGIFNKEGMPAPEDNWTWDDFQSIAKKLTNPKAQRWGTALATEPKGGFLYVTQNFGGPKLIPDKTGKYTWEAGFNLPATARVLEMFKDMVWKDKTALTGSAWRYYDARNQLRESKAGMTLINLNDATGWVGLKRVEPKDKKWEELVGIAAIPRGPEDVRIPIVMPFIFGINPTQTPEEIEATFNWMTYLFAGPYTALESIILGYTVAYPEFAPAGVLGKGGVINNRIPYRVDLGIVGYDPETHKAVFSTMDPYAAIPDDFLKTIQLVEAQPVKPVVNEYGMWEPNIIAFETALQAAISNVFANSKADPKTELDKAANVANKTALNVKLEGVTTEKMKNYYTALGDYYKKNFPKYYEEVFKGLLEEYYKVW